MKLRVQISVLLASLFLSVALFSPGCAGNVKLDPAGEYHGDTFLYQTDIAITSSYAVLDTFVTWEYTNRPLLSKQSGVTKFADSIRKDAKHWFDSAHALRATYAAQPTPENKINLQKALALIQTALTQAATYMAVPPTTSTPTE